MSILINALPIAAEINGHSYTLNADFRVIINIICACDDAELAMVEKQQVMLGNLYEPPLQREDFERGIQIAADFIAGGPGKAEEKAGAVQAKYYSFEKDADYIFAAFQQTHGIDLQAVEFMHWWKFLALFADLGANTVFCNLIGLRKRVATGKASKEERQSAREMGDVFTLDPVSRSIEDIEAERRFYALIEANKEKKNVS